MPSKAKIDSRFSDRVKNLEEHAADMAEAHSNQGAPGWLLERLSTSINPSNPASIPSNLFGRDQLEQQFDEATNAESPGTSGDLAAIQLQGDWLASLERAVRSRYLTPYTRAMAHASGRLAAAGDETGPLQRCTVDYIEDILKRAGS